MKLLRPYLTWTSFPRRVSTGFHGFLASKCRASKSTSSLWGSWCIRMCWEEQTILEFTLIPERCPQSHMRRVPAATGTNSGRRWRDGGRSALPKWNCWSFKAVKGISSLRCPRRNEQMTMALWHLQGNRWSCQQYACYVLSKQMSKSCLSCSGSCK